MISIAQPISQRSSDAITVMDGNLFAKNSFRPAVFQDTTAGTIALDSCGKMIFTRSDNSYWMRACYPSKHWVKILKTGDAPRFGVEDNSASTNRLFNFNNHNFEADSFANFNLYSKINPTGVDRGMYSNLGIANNTVSLWTYHSNGVSTRSYGFTATPGLTQMFATGHASGHNGHVQADTNQVILESDPNRLYLYHDSVTLTNFTGGAMNFRIRGLPETIDTSYKTLVLGPLGQLFLRPSLSLVNNGLSRRGDTIQLGAVNNSGVPLNHDTWINTAAFKLTAEGARASGALFEAINTGTGTALYGSSVSEYGLLAHSNSLYGVYGTSTTGNAIRGWTTNGNTAAYFEATAASTNTTIPVIQIKRTTSGTAADNIAGSVQYLIEKDNGANNTPSNEIISKLTTATSGGEISQLEFTGVNGAVLARKAALAGSGQWTWDGYPAITPKVDTNTLKPIAYNSSTGLIEPMVGWPGGSGSGGVDEFSELLDVTITSPKNAQRPLYDSITGKWVNRLPAYFNVKDYGAVGDSITDDRAAIIKARDAAYTAGGVLFFPAGKYRISDSILFIHPIRIQGVGKSAGLRNQYSSLDKDRFGPVQASSEIIVTDGKNGFVFDRQPADSTKAAFVVEYLTITSTVAAGSTTGGAFIVVRGMIQGTIIRDNTFYGGYVQVDIQSGFYQLVTDNHFSAPKIAGLKVGNNIRTDTGDFTVTENVFSSGTFNTIDGTDSTKAIWWHSGGGMRVINNKFDVCEFDMTHAYVYSIYIANTLDPTSVIIISNNSIENWRKSAVYMRGIVAPYIRSIVISNNQFASVGSTGPAVDMDHMESIDVSDNVMRDWNNGVAAPAIRVTNSIDVTIGKGEIRDYASSFDLTGSTNTHVDYMWGGDVAIGSKNTTNIAGLDTSLYTTETILGRETTGQFGSGVLELASKLADLPSGTPTDVGYITFVANSNVLADKRVAQIGATADGAATGGRGGILHFYTKPDGSSSLVERLRINSDGKFNFPSYSFGGTVATSLALSSTGDLIASTIIPQWAANGTHIYNNNSGNVGIGTATTPTTKLHIQFSSTGGDGLTIENTNSGVAARSMIKIINDQGLIGQFGSMSSTHATLPNFTLLESIKDFQIGTDQGVASGGASVINFVTGGYSVAPAFIIKGTGVLNGSSLAGSGTRMVVADAIGDLSTQTIPASDGNGIYGGSGSLPSDVVVTGGSGEELDFNGSVDTDPFISIVNAGTGVGLFANGNLFGLDGQSTNVGVRAFGTEQGLLATGENSFGATIKSNSTIGLLVQSVPSSTNTVQEVVRFERGSSGGAGANDIGGSAAFYSKTTDNSSQMTNRFVSKFTTATTASRTSQFTLVGVNSASDNNILNIDGDGSFTTYGKRIVAVVTSSAGTLTIGNAESYVFNGTTTTWTLPPVSGTTGYKYYLKNIGSGSITLNADSGSNEIYTTSAVNTATIAAGSAIVLISNGTYFTVN